MDHFHYIDGQLYAEEVPLARIAAQVGTPFYCYSTATIARHFTVFDAAFAGVDHRVCYALKANSNIAVLKTLASLGAGGDCVSEGEIRRCLAAGIPATKIVFSGVGKTREEMAFGLTHGIFQFNVESEVELRQLDEVARSLQKIAPVAVRINPDVDAKTHDKISTGRKEDKFGVDWTLAREIYKLAASLKGIRVQGISTHIGSQLTELVPFERAFKRLGELVLELRRDGHPITVLDLGGGLGIPYGNGADVPPLPEAYAKSVCNEVRHLGCTLVFEPGRLIVGNAGVLVSKVIYLKETPSRKFLVLDAAMNDLVRPALYDAYHEIVPVVEQPNAPKVVMDVVGPVCESADVFAKGRALPLFAADDLVAIRSAGAYGAVMASEYNARLLVPEVLVKGDQFAVVRRRESYEEMLAREDVPEWVF